MPNGKPAGIRCVQLTDENLCALFGQPTRPSVCQSFSADIQICGTNNEQALKNLIFLEESTA